MDLRERFNNAVAAWDKVRIVRGHDKEEPDPKAMRRLALHDWARQESATETAIPYIEEVIKLYEAQMLAATEPLAVQKAMGRWEAMKEFLNEFNNWRVS